MRLTFKELRPQAFKSFNDPDALFKLDRKPGVYLVRGINKQEPDLGANGAGKTSLFDSLYWVLTNRTIRDARPGAAIQPRGGKGAEVGLIFGVDDEWYDLERRRKPNDLRLNDEVIEDRRVQALVPLSDEALRRTIIVGQFGTLFLDLKPEAQSMMFSEILDLDVWLRASDKATTRRRSAQPDLDKARSEYDRALGRLEGVESQLATVKEQRDQYTDTTATRLKAARQEQTRLGDRLKALVPSSAGAQGRRGAPEKDLNAVEEAITALESSKTGLEEIVSGHNRAIAVWETKVTGWRLEIMGYRREPEVCPSCGQTVAKGHFKKKVKAVESLIEDAERSISVLGGLIRTARTKQDDLTERIKLRRDAVQTERERKAREDEEYRAHQDEVEELRTESATVQALIQTLTSDRNPYRKQVKDLSTLLDELEEEIKEAKQAVGDYEWEVSSCNFWSDAFKEIRLNQIDEALAELEVAVNQEAEELGLHGWYLKFQTERTTASGKVSHGFTTFIYPPGEETPVTWESYSGGESQRWHLAATFGLSGVLLSRAGIECNVEVLDEPSQHLSDEGIDDLLHCLQKRAMSLKRAIYFIDHRVLDRGNFDGIITVVKDENGSHIVEG